MTEPDIHVFKRIPVELSLSGLIYDLKQEKFVSFLSGDFGSKPNLITCE